MMTMTEDIAGFAAAFSLKTAPTELLPRVRETFLDSFGVMLAGQPRGKRPARGALGAQPGSGRRV